MVQQNIHEQLQQASQKIKDAQEKVLQAQGKDFQVLEQAEKQLRLAEEELQGVSSQAGTEATENSQFQQAFEELHDVRQQVTEAQQNINDVL
ncbi:hypothetical protein [Oceanobacillus bengalensis]|uniref:DUF2564 family protein n=1 Tax=Oceanobacillus bengalensis TaxID=1435466 RepID=A0A494Z3X0_9BACI|nr:hypothetical protein [Oceanobacillus bengalensis]RKQ17141.1 hypothetical protein D8M05_05615 [Oceanobacillus bengalensis]